MERCDIAWAAGLFEGEGCINIYTKADIEAGNLGKVQVRLTLNTTDRDVLDRFHEIMNYGHIGERKWYDRNHYKPSFCWSADAQAQVERILGLFMPYLGKRRKEKAMEALTMIEKKRKHFANVRQENMAVARSHNWRNVNE